MKTRILSVALLLSGCAVLLSTVAWEQARWPFSIPARALGAAIGGVLLTMGAISIVASLSARHPTRAFMRLDHFLPFLRKRKRGEMRAPLGAFARAAKHILPNRLFADPVLGKPGLIRKTLKRIGPTVLSSPTRRAIQTACFLLFLWLFFYVCWPYSARPAPPGRTSPGWRFAGIEQVGGQLRFTKDGRADWQFDAGQVLHVVDESEPDPVDGYVSALAVAAVETSQVLLRAEQELAPEQLDTFLLSPGPWALHETAPGRWPSHYTDELAAKEIVPADVFLAIDPLVSLSTAIAARSWVWSLRCAAVILIACVLIPRGFCGYLCPLGTLIDLFDWAIGQRIMRRRVPDNGWWVHIKYYLLAGTLVCALFGVLVSGYVAAIAVITRGVLFLGEPLQGALFRGWHQVPPIHAGQYVSIALFLAVLGLGLLRPRFWCKYVCPSGAVFSIANLLRVSQRKVESTCIDCNKCVEICPFDAIKPDYTTRVTDCTLCQTCGGVCPTDAIKFVERWNKVELKVAGDPPTGETALGRRGFLSLAAGVAAAVVGGAGAAAVTKAFGANVSRTPPVRPPGSVPEQPFLDLCIRCGQCFKVCPNNVLQAMGVEHGLENLWTPQVVADWAGCEPSCNACGQVCPTGAIRALPLDEKKVARMGLAVVDPKTCLPLADRQACQLCVDECRAAGYDAIEFIQVHTKVDESGRPLEDTGFLAPVVVAHQCVGCGLCQTRCHAVNVADKKLLKQSAIVVEAGQGKEDRLASGSYIELREKEAQRRAAERRKHLPPAAGDFFVPGADSDSPDPFGTDAAPPQKKMSAGSRREDSANPF